MLHRMNGFLLQEGETGISEVLLCNRAQVISGRARYKDASVALAPLKAL